MNLYTACRQLQHSRSTACGQTFIRLYIMQYLAYSTLSTEILSLSFYKLYKKALNTFLLYFYIYETRMHRLMERCR